MGMPRRVARSHVRPKTWIDEWLTGSRCQLQYGFDARLSVLLTTGAAHRHPLWRPDRPAGADGARAVRPGRWAVGDD